MSSKQILANRATDQNEEQISGNGDWQDTVPTMRERYGDERIHLSPRQREVLSLLCQGLPNKLISRQLGIAEGTVKAHICNIFRALGVSSRLEALLVARCWELDDPSLPRPSSGRVLSGRVHHR